jgi:hypothetical protein
MGSTMANRDIGEDVRVLLVEDCDYGIDAAERLRTDYRLDVTHAATPTEALKCIAAERYNVVVPDMIFIDQIEAFAAWMRRPLAQRVESLRTMLLRPSQIPYGEPFLLSGLAILYALNLRRKALNDAEHNPAVVVWTVPEGSRCLHMSVARQVFDVQVFCSKRSKFHTRGEDGTKRLYDAICMAHSGRRSIDTALSSYIRAPSAQPLGNLLYGRSTWKTLWPLLALGVRGRSALEKASDWEDSHLKGVYRSMAESVVELEPGLPPDKLGLTTLSDFAYRNHEFFLDDTVLRIFGPRPARERE